MILSTFVLEKLPVISAYPFLNVLLQCFRNRDHFLDFAVGYEMNLVIMPLHGIIAWND